MKKNLITWIPLLALLVMGASDAPEHTGALPPIPEKFRRRTNIGSESVAWAVKDAPYRAVVRGGASSTHAAGGIIIEVPEFGQMRADLLDAVLMDKKGTQVPLNPLWFRSGGKALFLAEDLRSMEDYYLYFGGGVSREAKPWQPRAVSLLMETRRLAGSPKCGNPQEMLNTWERSGPVDGMGFVPNIYHGDNPFGEDRQFATHYSGFLSTKPGTDLHLYTLSSDASFVFINGKCVLAAPGTHSAAGTDKSTPLAKIRCNSTLTRIDYYHLKANSEHGPGMALGWHQEVDHKEEKATKKEKRREYGIVPAEAFAHSGYANISRIEGPEGRPAPAPQVQVSTYIGFANVWYYELLFTLPSLPDGWTAEWEFEDGIVRTGVSVSRVLIAAGPQTVTLRLKRGSETLTGKRRIEFPEDTLRASINKLGDVSRYAEILAQDDPARLSPAVLRAAFVFEDNYGSQQQTVQFAEQYLRKCPDVADPLWAGAQEMRIRWMAQTNPKNALAELRNLPVSARQKHARRFDELEVDLLIYYLRDLSSAGRIEALAAAGEKGPAGTRKVLVRVGDLYRLAGKLPQAADLYRKAQPPADESGGRKLPAQDRAFSIAVAAALEEGNREGVDKKLDEWEQAHPLAKLTTDFLLLRARACFLWGRWREGLAELDSFKSINPESPYQIEVDFYRAHGLFRVEQKDEARKIWAEIAQKYPKHELAAESESLAKEK